MKKFFIILIAICCMIGLSGCKKEKKQSLPEVENTQPQQAEQTSPNSSENETVIVNNEQNNIENKIKKISEDEANNLIYNKCLKTKPELNGKKIGFMQSRIEMINGEEAYYIQVYEDFPDHIATIGYYYVTVSGKKIYEKNIATTQNVLVWESDAQGGFTQVVVQESGNFEEALVSYIYESIREYAKEGYILKNTLGSNIVDPMLTVDEVERNEDNYKKQIKEMLGDKTIFSDVFVRNGRKACTYKFERILNKLELGAQNGLGIGCYDGNGNKIYEYGKVQIEKDGPGNKNAIEYFGYTLEQVTNVILGEFRKYTQAGYVLKEKKTENSEQTGVSEQVVTSEQSQQNNSDSLQKLTIEELEKYIPVYIERLNSFIQDEGYTFIYFKNGQLVCEVNFGKMLELLEVQMLDAKIVGMNEIGIKAFIIK